MGENKRRSVGARSAQRREASKHPLGTQHDAPAIHTPTPPRSHLVLELLAHLAHALLGRLRRLALGNVADLVRDLHGAVAVAAHGAEVGDLGGLLKGAQGGRVHE
jgi:hypothetical protein